MPRKRKSFSLSPQRKASNPNISATLLSSATLPPPAAMSGNKKEMLSSMCEMFPNLEPSLVEMVLSEYTEVEIVMDYLLELSTASKREAQLESTGFEKIAADLDRFQSNSQSSENEDAASDQAKDYVDNSCLDDTSCGDLDMLLDEALDRYGLTNPEDIYSAEEPDSSVLEASASSIMPQQVQSASPGDTALYQENVENLTQPQLILSKEEEQLNIGTSLHKSNVTEPAQLVKPEADYEFSPGTTVGSINFHGPVASSEVPAVQKPRQESIQPVLPVQSNVPSVFPKPQINWNPMASAFYPALNQRGSFVTPVVPPPVHWPYTVCAGQPSGAISYNTQVPSGYVWNPFPQWTAQHAKPLNVPKLQPIIVPKLQTNTQIGKRVIRLVGKVLIMLRGASGSGKSTLARVLLEQNPTGIILSTDDYFYQNGKYQFNINCLSEAHDWNQKRAMDAFQKSVTPIIIDNTNLQGWEMKPYVSMAMKYKYKVTFREPDTWWKNKPKELERRNIHGVKKEKIIKMLENFERVTVNSILNLSSPKKPESAEMSLLTSDKENEASNTLTKEVNLSTTEAQNPAGRDGAVVSADQCLVLKEASSGLHNIIESIHLNETKTDNKPVNCKDTIQCLEDISIENQPYLTEALSFEACEQEIITCKADNADVSCSSSQLDERRELSIFLGDWPVEQTLRQRKPRHRKKSKSNSSDQPSAEEAKDCNLEQILNNPELVPKEEVSVHEDNLETEVSVENNCTEIDLQNERENQLNTISASVNTENKVLATCEADKSGVVASDSEQENPQVAVGDLNLDASADIDVMTRPSRKSSCRKCKLALSFSNSSYLTDGASTVCEPKEADSSGAEIITARVCACTQTEPQEFAIAWRVEKKNMEVYETFKVLTGKADRFKSKSLDTNESSQENIPYRMMHHKSTFVEEDEIVTLQDEDSLQILCKLFRTLSFEVLKDLFERCNKDLGWATNLLLDSGEKIYKDEYDQEELFNHEDECKHFENNWRLDDSINTDDSTENSELIEEPSESVKTDEDSLEDSCSLALENCTLGSSVSLVVAEELKIGNVLSSAEVNDINNQCMILDGVQPDQATVPDTIEAHIMWSSSLEGGRFNSQDSSLNLDNETNNILNEKPLRKDISRGFNFSNDEVHWETRDSQGDIQTHDAHHDQERVTEEKPQSNLSRSKESLKFDYLEFSLPPELAFQLTELFGPVGIDPGSLTIEDCVVPIDLNLAEAIHKKWKQSITERHNQEALSYQLLLEDFSTNDHLNLDKLLQEQESRLTGHNTVVPHEETEMFPFMDQWNTRMKKVSLRQIMSEEMALQAREDMV